MKQLHDKVNIVPVIGKADTLTPAELENMKKRVTMLFCFFCNIEPFLLVRDMLV